MIILVKNKKTEAKGRALQCVKVAAFLMFQASHMYDVLYLILKVS
jgi:hypothetical protein